MTIIVAGKCVVSDSVEYLSRTRDVTILEFYVFDMDDGVVSSVEELPEAESVEKDGDSLRDIVKGSDDSRVLVSEAITRAGLSSAWLKDREHRKNACGCSENDKINISLRVLWILVCLRSLRSLGIYCPL